MGGSLIQILLLAQQEVVPYVRDAATLGLKCS